MKPVINQFNGGEISPWLEGRIDLQKYPYSARLMRNFIPLVEGTVIRRGGSHYVASCKQEEAVHFKIIAEPSEADIYINNEFCDEIYCPIGEKISYTVSMDGYQPIREICTVTENTVLRINLISRQYRNTLTIESNPAGADIYINGIPTNEATVLRSSTAYYRVLHKKYEEKSGTIQVNNDIKIVVDLEMKFEIIPTPADAKVIINGQEQRSIAVQQDDIINYTVTKEGYQPKEGQIKIEKSLILYIDLINSGYAIGDTIFEKGKPGSYLLQLKNSGWYDVSICSAGGGGGGSAGKHNWVGKTGGSGAAFRGIIYLDKGEYAIQVGQGGRGGIASGRNATFGEPVSSAQAYVAGISFIGLKKDYKKFDIYLTPGIGGCGTGSYYSTSAGGTIENFVGVQIQSQTIKSNGITSSSDSLLKNGFGAGGIANPGGNGNSGTDGYCKLIYMGRV